MKLNLAATYYHDYVYSCNPQSYADLLDALRAISEELPGAGILACERKGKLFLLAGTSRGLNKFTDMGGWNIFASTKSSENPLADLIDLAQHACNDYTALVDSGIAGDLPETIWEILGCGE